MLREDGRDVEEEDLSTPDEIRLGQLVKEKYGTDYYILDKFPANARPFYTHRDPEDRNWTRSFDIFIRGQEICSGGQRIHDPDELRTNMLAAGISEDGMEDYLAGFDLGAPPHAGAGLGLERIVRCPSANLDCLTLKLTLPSPIRMTQCHP
jgi:aspartyl-tRNA synthetase